VPAQLRQKVHAIACELAQLLDSGSMLFGLVDAAPGEIPGLAGDVAVQDAVRV